MFKEFRDFIARGNVMDMAVGIIVGAAFTGIVQSIVADLMNPIIAIFTGGIDFSGWFYALDGNDYASIDAAKEAGAPVFAIGRFVMAVINFLIIAFAVFMMVKGVNRIKEAAVQKEEEAPVPEKKPVTPPDIELLTEIRDLLKK
ncbi:MULTISPECIES: large conductance mechanosensitive channel protein MscL [Donghicola]|jgi:large conductance mechanosensitive channel|uniref:Large-conductance mechanosensitive channel n=1 Tax=Donghicola eburneus TaxID=393278 RepID=A0A1M4N5K9_9RHOB|nr:MULTISPECIES: large conductance mechanosensitive channel protein MscL [Donghicola]MCT4576680.1 large conductance mechanosensitive channel protein MscL [Donghicola sp.]SCM69328.1 putative membrane protein [Donghicola eburneus]SFQ45397.1 large conductance mechanosensitive channel [Donghicola eburneus]